MIADRTLKIVIHLFLAGFALALMLLVASTTWLQSEDAAQMISNRFGYPILKRALAFIDGDKFERLAESLDPEDPFYEQTRKKLAELKKETQCLYLYTMAPWKGNIHRFIIDGGDPGDEGFSALGDEEDISEYNKAYLRTYEEKKPQFDTIDTATHWGAMTSCYMPIFNSAGKVVGIIGCDFELQELHATSRRRILQQGAMAAVIICASIAAHFLLLKVITAKNAQHEELRRKAEIASRAKSKFLATMSHEMRTPMNAIIGMTRLCKNTANPEKREYCLDRISGASQTLLDILNDVLDMSDLEAHRLKLVESDFLFADMLRRAIAPVTWRMEEKGQNFQMDVDEHIPNALYADRGRLAQVITNILGNACKFAPDGGHIALRVERLPDDQGMCALRFTVEDDGIGIAPEMQKKIFHSFEQADGELNRKYGGIGLGLTIARHIVEMMHGEIQVESQPGKGARFVFTVKAPAGAAKTGDDDAQEQRDFRGKRLLLAEDVEINREILISLLDGTGIEIDVAENGRRACEMFSANPDAYDMIFMDIQMPEIDGLEATARIRAMDSPRAKIIPIVAMSANAFQEGIEQCLASGMDDHVGKPLDIGVVLEKMEKYLNICA
ncbi:MAG: response regulator [Desulfovibrio sp.]|jgi:signal transduction histidine kinase/ActR/RegA family two-component response regulator|nr:response regulator [Desulfovibrio sp.]